MKCVMKSRIKEVINKNGCRCSEEALDKIIEMSENYIKNLILETCRITKYSKRKTVQLIDVESTKNKL